MECKRCLSLLGEYKDGELDTETTSMLKSHLEACPLCLAELRSINALSEIIASVKSPPVPDGFEDNVIRAMSKSAPRFSFIPSFMPVFFHRPVMALSALALLLAGGFFYSRPNSPPEESYAQLLISDAELRDFDGEVMDIFYGDI